MDPFINYLIKIGGMITILALFAIFLSFRFTNVLSSVKWPPEEQKCPDYWSHSFDSTGSEVCKDVKDLTNLGTYSDSTAGELVTPYELGIEDAEASIWSTTCNKKAWADSYGLTWDGVTNTSQSCDTDLDDTYDNSTLYQILQKV
tara:strand:+ start:1114 stop:1548 length:435 start_codon:yes stop_codon:yes gene_type:complete